jgi:tetratricopeptide (TPR) repeat protein
MSASTAEAATAASEQAQWLARIKRANGREGNYLGAYYLALQALAQWPQTLLFEHQAILALARLGALGRAIDWYAKIESSGRLPTAADGKLASEFAGLHGRLLKDLARVGPANKAKQYRRESAQTYASAFDRLGEYYLAINAASMYLACGDKRRAKQYAERALELAAAQNPADYWSEATQAEAQLILGQADAATAMLRAAAARVRLAREQTGNDNLDEVASTRRQLTWVAELAGAPLEILSELPTPRVLNWGAKPLPKLRSSLIDVGAAAGRTTIACGPLLSATDVEIADALLASGAKLHLVLPCEAERLAAHMRAHGSGVMDKFARLVGHPENVETLVVTKEGDTNEATVKQLCRQLARGLALLRARHLGVEPRLAHPGRGGGMVFAAIPAGNVDIVRDESAPKAPARMIRQPHAIVFGDVRGFSALSEAEQLIFIEHIVGGFAQAIKGCGKVEYAETAGDGLFIVLPDVLSAIDCCLRLQKVLVPRRLRGWGLPERLGIRLSAHVGPLYRRYDAVIRRHKFVGMEVIRTARIEPVTPVGEIFVTEQFAAMLAFAASDTFICEYAGLQPMAKNFGVCRMYSLRRTHL